MAQKALTLNVGPAKRFPEKKRHEAVAPEESHEAKSWKVVGFPGMGTVMDVE